MRFFLLVTLLVTLSTSDVAAVTEDVTVVAVRIGDSVVVLDRPVQLDSVAAARLMASVLQPYQDNGHYFARARIVRLEVSGESDATLELAINPGPVVRIRRVAFEGLERTDPESLGRFFASYDGERLTMATLDRIRAQAEAIGFIDFVSPIGVRVLAGYTEADLVVTFMEKRQMSFFGGGGYTPDDEAGLVWSAQLALNNLFGGGRQASVRSARPDKGRTELQIRYRQPLFWLGRDRGDVMVATRDYRDSFYEFAISPTYTSSVSDALDLSLGLGFRRVEPSDNVAGYSAYSTVFGLERSSLDNPINPSRGLRLHTSLAYLNRRYSADSLGMAGDSSFNETRTTVDIESYLSVRGPFLVHVGGHYRGFETGQSLPPPAELFLIGGPGTIRGYRTDQFPAQRAAYGTIEPRVRFDGGNLFLFYDAAYLNRTVEGVTDLATDEKYRSGYGLGLALLSAERLVRVSFGWGEGAAIDEPHLSVEFSADI
ncbi:BamA/TamA family outer membrane protein [bacterium]|nr:BamA/TamA family outer membrane protein [bacterium]